MTVVHIFKDFYPPTIGGIEQHMHLLCRSLAKTVDTVVLVPSRSRKTIEEGVDGIRVVRVPEFGRYASAPLCPTLPFWLRRLKPDVVHLHFPNPMGDLGYRFPNYPTKSGQSMMALLRELAENGARDRYRPLSQRVKEQG